MSDLIGNIEAKRKFLEVLSSPEAGGRISDACKIIGWSRQTIYDWKKLDNWFSNQIEASIIKGKESIADLAESQLTKKIKQGDTTCIIFALKHLRSQQYGEYIERRLFNAQEEGHTMSKSLTRMTMRMFTTSILHDENLPLSEEEKNNFLAISTRLIEDFEKEEPKELPISKFYGGNRAT